MLNVKTMFALVRKVSILCLFLFLSSNVYGRSYSDLISQIRINLNDTGPSASEYFYTDIDIVRAINIVEDEIVGYTLCIEGRFSTTTIAGQGEYSLPTDILGIPTRVSYYNTASTSTFRRLEYFSIAGLDTILLSWEAITDGLPKKYYLRGNKIGLYPAPSATFSTTTWNTLQVDYIVNPTDVSTTTLSNIPFNGFKQLYAFHGLIIMGAEALLTGVGYDGYLILLERMKNNIAERPDAFIAQPSPFAR